MRGAYRSSGGRIVSPRSTAQSLKGGFRTQAARTRCMNDANTPDARRRAWPRSRLRRVTLPTAYRVLARKYRPATFDDLIGQDAMVRTISNAFETGRIPQAWILTGVRGVGKTTTARILARALNYELPDGSVSGPDHQHAEARRALPGDHGEPAHRRDRDGRRLAQQRRRRAPDQRRHPLRAGERALPRSTSSTRCTCCRARRSTRC